MAISHKGFNTNVITLYSNGRVKENVPVSVAADDTCEQSANGTDFIGISVCERNNIVSVQVEGYVEVNYSGTPPTLGRCSLVSAGTVGVKVSEGNTLYRVLKVDTASKTVGFLL